LIPFLFVSGCALFLVSRVEVEGEVSLSFFSVLLLSVGWLAGLNHTHVRGRLGALRRADS
jgi:hypothetical protein